MSWMDYLSELLAESKDIMLGDVSPECWSHNQEYLLWKRDKKIINKYYSTITNKQNMHDTLLYLESIIQPSNTFKMKTSWLHWWQLFI